MGSTKNPSKFPIKTPAKSFQSPSFVTFKEQKHNFVKRVNHKRAIRASASNGSGSGSPGLYSSKQFELTVKNVNLVLEDVRPYLIADGGNVDVISVDDGVITLQLQACYQQLEEEKM